MNSKNNTFLDVINYSEFGFNNYDNDNDDYNDSQSPIYYLFQCTICYFQFEGSFDFNSCIKCNMTYCIKCNKKQFIKCCTN